MVSQTLTPLVLKGSNEHRLFHEGGLRHSTRHILAPTLRPKLSIIAIVPLCVPEVDYGCPDTGDIAEDTAHNHMVVAGSLCVCVCCCSNLVIT